MPRRRIIDALDRQPPDESYNPHDDRATPKPLTDFRALANLVKSAVGTGLFAMPNAFASVGLINGVIGTVSMGLLITVALHMLLTIHDRMCVLLRRPVLNYDQVVVASLISGDRKPLLSPRVATYLVDSALLLCYLGVGAVYTVFISGALQDFIDPGSRIDQGYYCLMLFPLLLLINMVKYLSDIAIVSILGNVLLFLAASWGVIHALIDGNGEDWAMIAAEPSLYPKFVGTAFFSMSSPGIVLAIQHDMAKPQNYTKHSGVLNQGMMFITVLHMFVGMVGYLRWGDTALGNFIMNQPTSPYKSAALIMQGLSIYFTYGLQCYLPISIVFEEYVSPMLEENTLKGSRSFWIVAVRFLITLVTTLLAALIPRVDLFIGLVGALCTSTLSTLIPVSLYILVHRGDYGRYEWRLFAGTILLTIGLFVTLCAVIINLRLIVDFFKSRY